MEKIRHITIGRSTYRAEIIDMGDSVLIILSVKKKGHYVNVGRMSGASVGTNGEVTYNCAKSHQKKYAKAVELLQTTIDNVLKSN